MLLKLSIIEKPKRFNLVEYFCSSGSESVCVFHFIRSQNFFFVKIYEVLHLNVGLYVFLGKKPVFHMDSM